ncbi:MAG TPA: glycosyltransferase family 4 protein [Dehalococcoidia bacterium]
MSVRAAIVSTYPPRRCGLASFAAHLRQGLLAAGAAEVPVVAVVREAGGAWPPEVVMTLPQDEDWAYVEAARYLNRSGVDAVLLQHEFGIFGGEVGRMVLQLLSSLSVPVITTLHTVLSRPGPEQRAVLQRVIRASRAVVAMAGRAVHLLRDVYGAPPEKIVYIPHGVPAPPPGTPEGWKERLGLAGRTVAMTFGLIGPGKGIELALDAMAEAAPRCPDLLYLVVGATHPDIARASGESYRQGLEERVRRLGLDGHVRFVNRYLDEEELLGYLAACDIYITPYQEPQQITSGTLTYAVAMGKAVISTPYAYAEERLGGGAGWLVPFGDAAALARALVALARNPELRAGLGRRARERARGFAWPEVGARYLDLVEGLGRREVRAVARR